MLSKVKKLMVLLVLQSVLCWVGVAYGWFSAVWLTHGTLTVSRVNPIGSTTGRRCISMATFITFRALAHEGGSLE